MSRLVPDYSGIRSKLRGPPEPGGNETETRCKSSGGAADFAIQGPGVHGVPGLVNVLGIESPGLTSSLAIAEHVADILHSA